MNTKQTKREFLQRYTNLAAAVDLLSNKRLTLLDPATWDDRNDTHFMEKYQHSMGAETVYALCFAYRRSTMETYHHWRIFANGSNGICIQFDKERLASKFDKDGLTHGFVEYVTSKNLTILQENGEIGPENLPFLKGSRYKAEKEYRVINLSRLKDRNGQSITIELEWIRKITLSPWLHRTLVPSVKKTLLSIDGCQNLNIGHSTLRNNSSWKMVGEIIGK